MAKYLLQSCAQDLACLADKLHDKIPKGEEWNELRGFLRETGNLLRSKDFNSGFAAIQRVLPYVEKAFSQVDKYLRVTDSYQITETLSQHFLVSEESKIQLEKYLTQTKTKMAELKTAIELFGSELDELLRGAMKNEIKVGFFMAIELSFKMNRITALIQACDERLSAARKMIDDLDTHVASKGLIATAISYLCFILSALISSTGNLPAGATLFAVASVSRKSSHSLNEYRKQLSVINVDHIELQSELKEWHFKFQAEQRNFLLICGLKYVLLTLIMLAATFYILGKAANFVFFSIIFIFLATKAETTKHMRYYLALTLAAIAMIMELQHHPGFIIFNVSSAIVVGTQILGFMQII